MRLNVAYQRTAKGEEELKTRRYGLRPVQRQVLVLMDGQQSPAGLLTRYGALTGLAEALEFLEANGLISPRGAEAAASALPEATAPTGAAATVAQDRARAEAHAAPLKAQLIAMALALVTNKPERIVARLEAAAPSHDGLLEAVNAGHKLLRLTVDEALAEHFLERARKILGRA
jgi:hypothetical protein